MIIPKDLSLRYYELIVHEDCNFRCTYCFDNAFSDREQSSHEPVAMSKEMIEDLFNFIYNTHADNGNIIISFFGGEPLLNWNFIENFVLEAKKNFLFPYEFTINTNASLLNKRIIDFMIENQFSIAISIDGKKDSHDLNRVDISQKPTWMSVIKYIPYIISKIPVAAEMTVTPNNVKYFAKNYDFLYSLGFSEVVVLWQYEIEATVDYLSELERQLKIIKKKHVLPPIYKRKISNKAFHQSPGFCFSPRHNVSIAPNGKIYFCHQLVPKLIESTNNEYFGDVYDGYYNNEYYEFMSKITEELPYEKCKSCPIKHWCKGGCLASNRIVTGDYKEPNESQCKIHKLLDKII